MHAAETHEPARPLAASHYHTVMVPYDFSEHSKVALHTALGLAQRLGSVVHLVHVVHRPAFAYGPGLFETWAVAPPIELPDLRERVDAALHKVVDAVVEASRPMQAHVVDGANIADALREMAEQLGADIIVMGTHGRTGLTHVLLGSVAERTLRQAPCPVLTVRAKVRGG